jgi:hypothetical protein
MSDALKQIEEKVKKRSRKRRRAARKEQKVTVKYVKGQNRPDTDYKWALRQISIRRGIAQNKLESGDDGLPSDEELRALERERRQSGKFWLGNVRVGPKAALQIRELARGYELPLYEIVIQALKALARSPELKAELFAKAEARKRAHREKDAAKARRERLRQKLQKQKEEVTNYDYDTDSKSDDTSRGPGNCGESEAAPASVDGGKEAGD